MSERTPDQELIDELIATRTVWVGRELFGELVFERVPDDGRP